MRSALWALLVCLLSGLSVSAQLVYYVDEKGRRVYINAEPPKPRYSVLLKSQRKKRVLRLPVQPPALLATPAAPSAQPAVSIQAGACGTDAPRRPAVAGDGSGRRDCGSLPWPNLDALIQQTAEKHAVDPDLVRAIIRVESNFNPLAVSNKGAMGLMQLVPGTAQRFGVGNVFDPVENVEGGVRYLKYLLSAFGGDLRLSLAAYNAGEKAVERHGGVPPYTETRQYVKKISTLYNNGLTLVSPSRSAGQDRWALVKYLDENGRWHFTNTDLP